jgi:hypothetical protein
MVLMSGASDDGSVDDEVFTFFFAPRAGLARVFALPIGGYLKLAGLCVQ